MTSPHERLDHAMDARRLDLNLRWSDVAAAARVAEVTLRAIRSGSNRPSALTKRRIEEALQWAHGSVDAIMSDGEPTPIEAEEEPATDNVRTLTPRDADDEQLADIAEQLRVLQRKVEELRNRRA